MDQLIATILALAACLTAAVLTPKTTDRIALDRTEWACSQVHQDRHTARMLCDQWTRR